LINIDQTQIGRQRPLQLHSSLIKIDQPSIRTIATLGPVGWGLQQPAFNPTCPAFTKSITIQVGMSNLTLRIDNQGRIMLPAFWRKDAGVGPSTELLAVVDESGALVLETREQGLRRARALVRKYIPAERVLSDELVRDRRGEAAIEEGR
jgi:bifunctional DNA-binding transcriptional regulator/antitoxin component of YhaV-PrlF toxin-antitoxin module